MCDADACSDADRHHSSPSGRFGHCNVILPKPKLFTWDVFKGVVCGTVWTLNDDFGRLRLVWNTKRIAWSSVSLLG